MSSGWLPEEATMTMESEAREIQCIARETENASGRDPRDVTVETGIAVHRKNYAAEREGREKAARMARSVRS
jgi:hypothetical protein